MGWFLDDGSKLHGFGIDSDETSVGLYEEGILKNEDVKFYDQEIDFIAYKIEFTNFLIHNKELVDKEE